MKDLVIYERLDYIERIKFRKLLAFKVASCSSISELNESFLVVSYVCFPETSVT